MAAPTLPSYRHEFAKRAEWRREEERHVFAQITEQEKEKKRERERERQDETLMDWAFAALASETDIAAFTAKIDERDAATVEALMENEKALAKVREELRIMLDKAYVLPDGRRVFKTEDGTRVFDEHGQEVMDFDAQQIEEWRPRWEKLDDINKEKKALVDERRQLIDYQERLDEIREEVGKDGLTKGELDELEKRLERDMPDSVRGHLRSDAVPDHEQRDEPGKGATFKTAAKLDMPAL